MSEVEKFIVNANMGQRIQSPPKDGVILTQEGKSPFTMHQNKVAS